MPARATSPRTRHVITLDLPSEMVAWMDAQAHGIMSRSAFARALIAQAMQGSGDGTSSGSQGK